LYFPFPSVIIKNINFRRRKLIMNGTKYEEFMQKYVRTGSDVIVPKEQNPFPQMKTDTFRLSSTPDFGGFGGGVDWGYIHEPVDMYPELKVSECDRIVTLLGGSGVNYVKLRGEVEITLGRTKEDAGVFKFGEAVSFYVEKGMLYNINVTKIDSPEYPIHFNEFTAGGNAPVRTRESAAPNDTESYARYIKSGDEVWAKAQPHVEVIYPVIAAGSSFFDAGVKVRRTWMPASIPHSMVTQPHSHDYTEYMVFYGTNPDDISDLGGVVEFSIGENEDDMTCYRIEKSTIFCMKPGVWHNPMVFAEIRDKRYPIVFAEISYAHGHGAEGGNTDWLGAPPVMMPDDKLANDVRRQFNKAFATARATIVTFPEDKWLEPHGDEYYIPGSIAYHIASYVDGSIAGGYRDPDFRSKLPFGNWHELTRDKIPGKAALLAYYDEAIARAKKALSTIRDEDVTALLPPEMARMGGSQVGAYMSMLREITAHTGEMNKMLIENGKDDIWM